MHPAPWRVLLVRQIIRRFSIGTYKTRLHFGAMDRPWYGWCMFYAAYEAKELGFDAMTVIEFGVAGGSGLDCLCRHRDEIQKVFNIEIAITGFDTGQGLPESSDPRDLKYWWPSGSFEMDRKKLDDRVAGRAELVIGDVSDTVENWACRSDAPLGAVMFDLDYFTSTDAALKIFNKSNLLPRVWCYMDDIVGFPENGYSDHTGVREAINQFKLKPERDLLNDHLSQAYVFEGIAPEPWHQLIYLYHRLSHPQYNVCLSPKKHQLRLD
jgi:hypothetical protein